MATRLPNGVRAARCQNPTARALFELMDRKKTNLGISADVHSANELLRIADVCGPYMCVLKTHIDVLDDFNDAVVPALQALAAKHDFLIFEDRKFADIGNTAKQQYQGGIYRMASWAHIVNAHAIPGPGLIQGLREVGLPLGRGLLLLAEMSSAGSLAIGPYTEATVDMARAHRDFVIGFVAGRCLSNDESDCAFIVMSPGVNLDVSGDALGQQYNTPQAVIRDWGSDVILVGRGIYQAKDVVEAAIKYRDAGWAAYEESLVAGKS